MVDQSEQTTDDPDVDEVAPSRPVVDDLTDIKSLDDAKEFFTDGLGKLRASSAEDLKKTGLKVVNRFARAWRNLVDGD